MSRSYITHCLRTSLFCIFILYLGVVDRFLWLNVLLLLLLLLQGGNGGSSGAGVAIQGFFAHIIVAFIVALLAVVAV